MALSPICPNQNTASYADQPVGTIAANSPAVIKIPQFHAVIGFGMSVTNYP
ncbi:hypothetical protein CEV34_1113 [Brucella pseudogrignonensis]|uniref:Uncharacterized protein n=1 Tax=Brucella pseudogrignonensis TaxID=419475 RepID=A0A256GN00_9HYPH|nr:hypothetical protein CEV34_1113 [Brucella pseudogrignonensis]